MRKRSRCQGSGGGLGTDTALVFWDTGNCLILSHSARERRLSVCVRGRCPCAWRPPLPRVSSVRVCAVCVCVRAHTHTTISREQGPNKLSFIPTPLACGQCCGGHRYQVLRKQRARTRAHALSLSLSLSLSGCRLREEHRQDLEKKIGKETHCV